MGRGRYFRWKRYKQIRKENQRLEEEKKSLMADIRILVQDKFSSDKAFVKSIWWKHFEKDEAFKKLWEETQPRKDRGNE